MDWINTKEKLPKTDSNVLAYVRIVKHNARYIAVCYYEPLDEVWFTDKHILLLDDGCVVDFWQPLPEAPK